MQSEHTVGILSDNDRDLLPGNRDQTTSTHARRKSPSQRATICARPGPRTDFLRSAADFCIYGGAAGGGKTVGLILEPLRHVSRIANFTAVFFRRTTPQITNPRGLRDESQNFYPRVGETPHIGGARVALATRQQDQFFPSAA